MHRSRGRHGIVETLIVVQGLDGLVEGGGEALFREEGEDLLLVVSLEDLDVPSQHEERGLEVVRHHGVLVLTLRSVGGWSQLDHPVCKKLSHRWTSIKKIHV